ncbi:hypothetical protein [Paracnuella aquatica]|uniref:hypothetical protein n=1 Tax=Paracnuella aquatica TaxID=2268757 RepID=UPI000F505B06|nr:hypothetical protein [Paracnuella aquatica]RPD46041.1 hypothetical protein DRJ53_14810 [Paracnuella aquatica]
MTVSVIIGLGYVFFMFMAFSSNPRNKYYNQLFKPSIYLLHLALTITTALYGLHRVRNHDVAETAYFIPVLFLIIFRLFDWIVMKSQGRHILIVTKGDHRPADYKWWIDGVLSFLSFIVPFLISVFIMTQLQQNYKRIVSDGKEDIKIDPIMPQ